MEKAGKQSSKFWNLAAKLVVNFADEVKLRTLWCINQNYKKILEPNPNLLIPRARLKEFISVWDKPYDGQTPDGKLARKVPGVESSEGR